MRFKRALAFSVIINLFFLGLCLIFGDLKFGAIDDYFMAARLTGALGTDYTPHLIFVNSIYGYALLPFYHLFPKIGWYYIGEMFSVFLSLSIIGYILLQRCGECWGAILTTLFTALLASDFYLAVQFTQCASILSAAGMLLFAYGVVAYKRNDDCNVPTRISSDNLNSVILRQNDIWFNLWKTTPFILGIILMLWGSVMRWQAFLMGLPFFCIGMLFILKDCWKAKWNVFAGLAILFGTAFAMHLWDQNLYKAPEYEEFIKFQGPRVILGDNGNYNQNAVYEDAEELGLSGKDFFMLKNWIWYDTETFSTNKLNQYTKIAIAYQDKIPLELYPQKLLHALSNSLHSPLFWAWFTLCIAIYITNPKKAIYSWVSLILITFLMTFLLSIGRLVYRVESGFWLFAAVMTIPQLGYFCKSLPIKIFYTIICIIAIANIYSYASSGKKVRSPERGDSITLAIQDTTDYTQVFSFIKEHPNKLFLLSDNTFRRFSHHRNPPYLAESTSIYRNTISFGYWTPYLPEVSDALKYYGITNPIKEVVNDNVIVLNEPHLVDFLQRHYYDSVTVDTLKKINEITFLKYRLATKMEDKE